MDLTPVENAFHHFEIPPWIIEEVNHAPTEAHVDSRQLGVSSENPSYAKPTKKKRRSTDLEITTSRKRIRDPTKWKRNIRKAAREKGEEYTTELGKHVSRKTLKPPCRCRLKCYEKFNESQRNNIFNSFYKLSKQSQDQYLVTTIEEHAKNRSRIRKSDDTESRRQYTRKYYLKRHVNSISERIEVCLVMYLNTFDITPAKIRSVMDRKRNSSAGICPDDQRGKHNNHRKISDEAIEMIGKHIQSFHVYKSLDSRSHRTKKYLDPDLSILKMYKLYCAYCTDNEIDAQKESLYRKIFNEQFKLSFQPPKNGKPVAKLTSTERKKTDLIEQKQTHLEVVQKPVHRNEFEESGKLIPPITVPETPSWWSCIIEQDNAASTTTHQDPSQMDKSSKMSSNKTYEENLPTEVHENSRQLVESSEMPSTAIDKENPVLTEIPAKPIKKKPRSKESEAAMSRKRIRDPSKWKKNVRKAAREKGEEYVTALGKKVSRKTLKPACNCRLKCFEKFSESQRKDIFDSFYKLSKQSQDQYLVNTIEEHAKKVQKTRNKKSRRQYSRKYFMKRHLNSISKKIEVCLVMYLNTFDLTPAKIRSVMNRKRKSCAGICPDDQRGRHNNRRKISDEAIAMIRKHIQSFPVHKRLDSRSHRTKKYLDPNLNISKMYKLYCTYCSDNKIDAQKGSLYRKIFNEQFKLSFQPPRNAKPVRKMNATQKKKKDLIEQKQTHLEVVHEQLQEQVPGNEFVESRQLIPPIMSCGSQFYAPERPFTSAPIKSCPTPSTPDAFLLQQQPIMSSETPWWPCVVEQNNAAYTQLPQDSAQINFTRYP